MLSVIVHHPAADRSPTFTAPGCRHRMLAAAALALAVGFGPLQAAIHVENFEDGTARRWTSVGAAWNVNAGRFAPPAGEAVSMALFNTGDWQSDFTLRAGMKTGGSESNARIGAVYSYVDADNYCEVLCDVAGGVQLNVRVAGAKTTLATGSFFGATTGAWMDLEIIRRGDATTVWVGGTRVFRDFAQPALAAGRVGLIATANPTALFDNVSIVTRTRIVYSENFADAAPAGWTAVAGRWSAEANAFHCTAVTTESVVLQDAHVWSDDYVVGASIRLDREGADEDEFGLVYNYITPAHHAKLLIAPVRGTARLVQVIAGVETVVGAGTFSAMDARLWCNAEVIRLPDGQTRARINGRTIVGPVAQPQLTAGRIGLVARNAPAAFARLSVTTGGVPLKPSWPKIAGMNIGNPKNYDEPPYKAQLARHDLVIFGFYRGWNRNGWTPRRAVQAVKALNPDLLAGNYTVPNEAYTNAANPATAMIHAKLSTERGPRGIGDWWARTNTGALVSTYPGTANINVTEFVAPDAEGDRFPQWFARLNGADYFDPVPEFDVWYSDNLFYRPRRDSTSSSEPDWDRDGVNDSQNTPAVRAYYRRGQASYLTRIMQLRPDLLVMANVDGNSTSSDGYLRDPEYQDRLPLAFYEGALGSSYSAENSAGWEAVMRSYRSLIANAAEPRLAIFAAQGGRTAYAFLRYALATALLDDGYFCYSDSATGYGAATWFDEYDLHLGRPIDPPPLAPWQNGVYRRGYENGAAFVNPRGNGSRTVTIEPGYRRFGGRQDATTNNGQPVTTLTLGDRQGVILVTDPRVAAQENGQLSNLSIRAQAGTGADALIVGFTLAGDAPAGTKTILIRGLGPALDSFAVASTMADPMLEVSSSGTVMARNDNWGGASDVMAASARVGAFALPSAASKDAALVVAGLTNGSYTVQLTSTTGGAGVALAEIYDASGGGESAATGPRLTNLSARTFVGTGDATLIAGFVVSGGPRRVLIRAAGPALAAFGVTRALADPRITLFRGTTRIAENDDWSIDDLAPQRTAGAFDFTPRSRDSALVVTLTPGGYTVQLTSAGGPGVALLEVYELR